MAMLTTLLSFNGGNGTEPYSGLIADAAGDLFGTKAPFEPVKQMAAACLTRPSRDLMGG